MNCLKLGQDSTSSAPFPRLSSFPVSPPQTPDSQTPPTRRTSKTSSLSSLLGSIFLPSSQLSSRSRSPSPPLTPACCEPETDKNPPRLPYILPLTPLGPEPGPALTLEQCASIEARFQPSSFPVQQPPAPPDDTMDKMAPGSMHLHPASAAGGANATSGRLKQVKDAQDMARKVGDLAKKSNQTLPAYEFIELIGKGSFGRVYKSRSKESNNLVAVKIIDVDGSDYKLAPSEKDQTIQDFLKEIKILRTLKDSKAKNINVIHDAFGFHSQLWIISEYCPGGSVHTLMRASPTPGLDERFIVVIARELAIALKHVHEAGIIHRDVKAANILITQDGQLQLCDFGVSGVLESSVAKRSTIIGTPFWMAPELLEESAASGGYGTEVDSWAFGCTLYELATGLPPNANIAPHRLPLFLKQAPRLEGEKYSAALKEFVAFCLEERPQDRPSAEKILRHAFVATSSKRYPTVILRQLIERFAVWESAGGQRSSLFQPFGAAAPTSTDPFSALEESDEWNFSTTDDFAEQLLNRFPPRTPDGVVQYHSDEETPKQKRPVKTLNAAEKHRQEQRAIRGARKMARLFDESAEPYEYSLDNDGDDSDPFSDLPFRRDSTARSVADRETIIDLDTAFLSQDHLMTTSLVDVDTIRANKQTSYRFLDSLDDDDDDQKETNYYMNQETKRFTRDWKFPTTSNVAESAIESSNFNSRPRTLEWTMAQAVSELEPAPQESYLARPPLKHTVTEPVGNIGDFLHPANIDKTTEVVNRSSMIDLDDADPTVLQRQMSYTSISGYSSNSVEFEDNPFYHDDDLELQNSPNAKDVASSENIRPTEAEDDHANFAQNQDTLRAKRVARTSTHMYTNSEPNAADRTSTSISPHKRISSLSSDTQFERIKRGNSIRKSNGGVHNHNANAEPEQAYNEAEYGTKRKAEIKDWWTKKIVAPLHEPHSNANNEAVPAFDTSRLRVHNKNVTAWHNTSSDDPTDWEDDDTSLSEVQDRDTSEIEKSLRSLMNQRQSRGSPRRDNGASPRANFRSEFDTGAQSYNRGFGSVKHPAVRPNSIAARRAIGNATASHAAAALSLSDSHQSRVQSQEARANVPRSLRHRRPRRGKSITPGMSSESSQQRAAREQSMSRFPQLSAVNPNALAEEAAPELVESELNRLLGDFMNGLRVTRELLEHSSARGRQIGAPMTSGREAHQYTTEEE